MDVWWVGFVGENGRVVKGLAEWPPVLSECVKLRLNSIAVDGFVVTGIRRNIGSRRSTVKSDTGAAIYDQQS